MQIAGTRIPSTPLRFARGSLSVEIADGTTGVELLMSHGAQHLGRVVLGVVVDGVDLGAGATVVGRASREVREHYVAHLGKAAGPRAFAHDEHLVRLDTAGVAWAVVIRLADDGLAFRYELPATASELGDERTRIEVPAGTRTWVLDYQTWYETPRFGAELENLTPGAYGFPVLLRVAHEQYLLLTEADIDGRSSGAHAEYDGTAFTVMSADPTTAVEPGHRTPWRVAIVGDLGEIVRSQFVDELAPAAATDTPLPRPGRGAWSWWSNQYSGAYLDVQKRFSDFAAEQGWEHVLVDCGWDAAWVPELVSHASARGVQVHLWSSWSDLDGPVALKKLALWRSWGVAGIKVDFMESEARERYRWYDAIIAESARVGLMVNFHGSVIPRGWARTHPHVVSYEAVRGAEYYVFYGQPLTAAHNVILPFTRNVVGSMDYTPVTFSAPRRETSDGHELALGVVFESGITHFADDPDRYRERPDAAALLAELPPVWHDVRLQEGDPDSHVVLARRGGERWFVGGLSSRETESELAIDLAALIDGPADVWIVGDGDRGLSSVVHEQATGRIVVSVAARGGFAAVVAPVGTPLRTAAPRAERSLPSVQQELVVLAGSSTELGADATSIRAAPGWSAVQLSPGRWTVQPDEAPASGDFAVFAFEGDAGDGVPVVSHARVVVPFAPGEHVVSRLPFLAASNALGPVERDLANGGGDPRDGAELTVCGAKYVDGIGVAQESVVGLALAGSARRLTGLVAIDDETPGGSAFAVVRVDGVDAVRIELTGSVEPQPIDLPLDGVSVLTLVTEPRGGREAHVDWLGLRIHA